MAGETGSFKLDLNSTNQGKNDLWRQYSTQAAVEGLPSQLKMPKRILMTADTVGGVWTYALELSAALGSQGIEVALATMGSSLSPQQSEEAGKIQNLKVFDSHFKLEWMENPWDDVRQAGEWLLELERQLQPDLVHLNGYTHAALPWQAPTLVVGHSCVVSWWEAVKNEPAPVIWDRYRQEVRRGLRTANLVVAPSAAMLEAIDRHYGSFANSKVIANGRDPSVFCPAEKKEFVLTAGRLWDEAKNVAALESIAPQLLWPICIAGEEKYPDGGTDGIHASATSYVRRLGRLSVEELASWYARASIYALPARYEPFGLSVLEAALSGCALVLGDIPSLREIWRDAALFVKPDDREAIACTINTLISDTSLRKAFATKARKRALKFTPHRMASSYLEAYQDLMSQRQSVFKRG